MNAMRTRRWSDVDAEHIDVRGLPPPQPLVEILTLAGAVAEGRAVIVHHDRDPLMLYPELAGIGWGAERIEGEPGEVRLRLERLA
jgi:uncharacterized protein (DUF2249 family)